MIKKNEIRRVRMLARLDRAWAEIEECYDKVNPPGNRPKRLPPSYSGMCISTVGMQVNYNKFLRAVEEGS